MAKRPARGARARAPKRRSAKRAPASPVRKRFSRLIQFTPRMIEQLRHRYIEDRESPETIARSVGLSKRTIQRLVSQQGWVRQRHLPRDLSRADQLTSAARALEEGRLAEAQAVVTGLSADVDQDDTPVDINDLIERLLRGVRMEIGVHEAMRAHLRNEPQSKTDALKTSHTLGSLADTLNRLQRMRSGEKAPVQPYDDYDDIPTDLDAFRNELARRINEFVQSRSNE